MPLIDLNGLGHFKDRENAMIAEDFSASKAYAAGDYCYYNGTLYKFKTAHAAGAWTIADVEAAKLAHDVSDLKESISLLDGTQIIKTASGAVASFNDGVDNFPVKSLIVDIEPVQSGSGDPSPDNVRPITGWTGAKVTRTGKNLLSTNARYWNYNIATDGTIVTENNRIITDYIPCNQNDVFSASQREYNFDYVAIIAFDRNKNILGRNAGNNLQTITYSVPENARYIRFQTQYASAYDVVTPSIWGSAKTQLEKSPTATEYEPCTGDTYDITFPTEAGTVYGGTLDATTGKLTVTHICEELTASMDWGTYTAGGRNIHRILVKDLKTSGHTNDYELSHFKKIVNDIPMQGQVSNRYSNFYNFEMCLEASTTNTQWKQYLTDQKTAGTPVQLWRYIATPIVYDLTPTEMTTLLGTNNIWADTGDVEVTYYADSKTYIDDQNALVKALIAPVLDSMVADTALVVNDFRIVDNTLYRVTANIASGGTLTINTNVVVTTVADVLKSLLN